jgi:hypothetical protein
MEPREAVEPLERLERFVRRSTHDETFLFGEGREIFVTKLREGIIQRALGHSQLDAHLGKSNTDGFRVQDRDAHFSF